MEEYVKLDHWVEKVAQEKVSFYKDTDDLNPGEFYDYPELGIQYMKNAIILFNNPTRLEQYSEETASRILWRIISTIGLEIFSTTYPLVMRLAFIDSCCTLFDKWFSNYQPAGDDWSTDICFNFWNILYGRPSLSTPLTNDQYAVVDAIFASLCRILGMKNIYCQYSALNGFRQLQDERCHAIIDGFLEKATDPDLIAFAQQTKHSQAS